MTKYREVSLGEIFEAVNGHPRFVRDYIDAHPGPYPVYSASLAGPFGYVHEHQFDGRYLTWVMNGYGGRVQEISGRFSANRDRGVFIPRKGIEVPDLTYLRFAMEPQLVAAAVGRRVDGRLNEYTKLYPSAAMDVVIQLPVNSVGKYDYTRMSALGERFRKIEAAQEAVRRAQDPLLRAEFVINVPEPSVTVGLDDSNYFALSIGKRVLRTEHAEVGISVYSANARVPFGNVVESNLSNFEKPSLLWGIDGNFDWNLIQSGKVFATTDHCGRLQILDDRIDPEYAYWYLQTTRGRYGFDRVYRASLQNMKAEVTLTLPIDKKSGKFSLVKQRAMAKSLCKREHARIASLSALDEVLKARITEL